MFNLGRVSLTCAANDLVDGEHATFKPLLDLFKSASWGDAKSVKANNETLENGCGDLLGSYELNGKTLWIRTEINGLFSDHNTTIIMLPSDY